MMKNPILGLILVLLTIHSHRSFAYDPDTGHTKLSDTALSIYQQCFSDNNVYQGQQQRIIEGDIAMDKGLPFSFSELFSGLKGRNVFSVLFRPLNWHFYNPDLTHLSKVGLVEQSQLNLWNDLIEGFWRNNNYHQKLFLGGIMHLIEDSSVPAHIVPVYHGPTAVAIYGPIRLAPLVGYMMDYDNKHLISIKDGVDDMPINTERLKAQFNNHRRVWCHDIKVDNLTLADIRLQVVQKTKQLLQQQIPNCPGVIWHDFWIKPQDDQYFGRYNIKRNSPLFGEAGTLYSSGSAICDLTDNDSRYSQFVYRLHLNAVKADLKVLRWGHYNMSYPPLSYLAIKSVEQFQSR